MSRAKSHIPEGLQAVIPQLVVADARAFIAFCEAAFGAVTEGIMPGPDGKGVMHCHLRIGGAPIFCSDAVGFAPRTSANLFVYLPDVDAAVTAALAAGGKLVQPVADMPWGDRWGMLQDPFGSHWQVATHVEDMSPEEMQRRMKAAGPPEEKARR